MNTLELAVVMAVVTAVSAYLILRLSIYVQGPPLLPARVLALFEVRASQRVRDGEPWKRLFGTILVAAMLASGELAAGLSLIDEYRAGRLAGVAILLAHFVVIAAWAVLLPLRSPARGSGRPPRGRSGQG